MQLALESGEVHLAKEIVVFSLTPNRREDYGTRVVAAIGVCGYETVAVNKRLLNAVINIWKTDPRGEKMRGPLPDVLSDGASVLAQAEHQLFDHEFEVDDKSPLVETFRNMDLFPKYCGVGDVRHVVDGRDSKHVGKRVRTRANTKTLGFTVATFKFVKAFLRRFILDAGLATEAELRDMFSDGGADAQNVPAMLRLLTTIAKLGSKTTADFPDRESGPTAHVLREIRVLSAYCACFVSALAGKDLDGVQLNVTGHLENLSTLAHLAIAIFRKNGTRFVPAQNYQNTQRWIRAAYWSARTAQLAGVKEYYLFFDSTDPLEQHFGITRELHGAGTMFDVVQFEDRTTTAMSIAKIYGRHPSWRQGPRRLTGSLDHLNPVSWVSTKKRPAP